MYTVQTEIMKKIHIWIGETNLSEEELESFFLPEDEDSEFLSLLKDVNEIDPDFAGVLKFDENKSASDVLRYEVPINLLGDDVEKSITACNSKGVKSANAVFYLTDSTVEVLDAKEKPAGLTYIGVYNSSL